MKFLSCLFAVAWSVAALAQPASFDKVEIKTTKITDTIYMLEGEGGNIGVSAGEDGVVLIDDQYAPLTPKILAAVKAISDKPIRFVINTHWHADHTGGNENLGNAGVVIVAHDNVYKRLTSEQFVQLLNNRKFPPLSRAGLPVITFNDTVTFRVNGDEIVVHKIPPAHTDGDSFVRFRKANVIHTGDVFAAYRYPFIDVENGGSVRGVVKAMDVLLPTLDDNTKVIPGHGPLSGKKDVVAFRAMMAKGSARVEAAVKSRKTLEQVIASKPTREFDDVWGKFRKPEQFAEILYYGYAPRRK
jgi:glyoxylase-like metal-dependent hydrolase (beta-lactamase superfamily II)